VLLYFNLIGSKRASRRNENYPTCITRRNTAQVGMFIYSVVHTSCVDIYCIGSIM